jgi:hypothetical protein
MSLPVFTISSLEIGKKTFGNQPLPTPKKSPSQAVKWAFVKAFMESLYTYALMQVTVPNPVVPQMDGNLCVVRFDGLPVCCLSFKVPP